MVEIKATSEKGNEYTVSVPSYTGDWLLGYFIQSRGGWMFKPVAASIFGSILLSDIAAELAKLNGTTLQ